MYALKRARVLRVEARRRPVAAAVTDRSPWDWYAESCSCSLPHVSQPGRPSPGPQPPRISHWERRSRPSPRLSESSRSLKAADPPASDCCQHASSTLLALCYRARLAGSSRRRDGDAPGFNRDRAAGPPLTRP